MNASSSSQVNRTALPIRIGFNCFDLTSRSTVGTLTPRYSAASFLVAGDLRSWLWGFGDVDVRASSMMSVSLTIMFSSLDIRADMISKGFSITSKFYDQCCDADNDSRDKQHVAPFDFSCLFHGL